MEAHTQTNIGGFFRYMINRKDGTKYTSDWQSNLITTYRLGSYTTMPRGYARIGTSSFPNKNEPTGTAEKVGDTVTATGSDVDFNEFKNGDFILFQDGTSLLIKTVSSASVVTTTDSTAPTNIPAQAFKVFRCNATHSISWPDDYINSARGDEVAGNGDIQADGSKTYHQRWGFAVQATAFSFNMAFVGQRDTSSVNTACARFYNDTPIEVPAGDELFLEYKIKFNPLNNNEPIEFVDTIAGWPHEYNLTEISSDGSNLTLLTDAETYYIVGDEVKIVGTTGYDGQYVVASIDHANKTYTMASTLNIATENGSGTLSVPNANYSITMNAGHSSNISTKQIAATSLLYSASEGADVTNKTMYESWGRYSSDLTGGITLSGCSTGLHRSGGLAHDLIVRNEQILGATTSMPRMTEMILSISGSSPYPAIYYKFEHPQTKPSGYRLSLVIEDARRPVLTW